MSKMMKIVSVLTCCLVIFAAVYSEAAVQQSGNANFSFSFSSSDGSSAKQYSETYYRGVSDDIVRVTGLNGGMDYLDIRLRIVHVNLFTGALTNASDIFFAQLGNQFQPLYNQFVDSSAFQLCAWGNYMEAYFSGVWCP